MVALAQAKLRRQHLLTLVSCLLVAIVEGFDTQIVAFVAPIMVRDMSISPYELGMIFSAGIVGLTGGTLVGGPLGDRAGRRPAIILSVFSVSLFTFLAGFARSAEELIGLRLLTGLGLGVTLPNIFALATDYAPAKLRRSTVMILSCGFPIGASGGALVTSFLIESVDWQTLFLAGGLVSFVMGVALMFTLPEALHILLRDAKGRTKALNICRSLLPGEIACEALLDQEAIAAARPSNDRRPTFATLFRDGRARLTLTLCILFFCTMLISYSLINWLPTLLAAKGLAVSSAIGATTAFNMGGIVGAGCLAWLALKVDMSAMLAVVFGLIALCVVALGVTQQPQAMMALVAVCGALILGAQFSLNALASTSYDASLRSTGLGFALGVGRLGAVSGPLCLSALLTWQFSQAAMFAFIGLPAITCIVVILILGRRLRQN